MAWFSRKPKAPPISDQLETAVGSLHELQFKLLSQQQDFLSKLMEMSVTTSARNLGIRRARGARRNAKGQLLPDRNSPPCRICAGASVFTEEQLRAHRELHVPQLVDGELKSE